MTDPLRDALRECEAYFEVQANEYVLDGLHWQSDRARQLLVAVQAALRTQPQSAAGETVVTWGDPSTVYRTAPTQGFRAGAYERHMARTPRIASDEMVEAVSDAIIAAIAMQGIVLDADSPSIDFPAAARIILAAMEPSK